MHALFFGSKKRKFCGVAQWMQKSSQEGRSPLSSPTMPCCCDRTLRPHQCQASSSTHNPKPQDPNDKHRHNCPTNNRSSCHASRAIKQKARWHHRNLSGSNKNAPGYRECTKCMGTNTDYNILHDPKSPTSWELQYFLMFRSRRVHDTNSTKIPRGSKYTAILETGLKHHKWAGFGGLVPEWHYILPSGTKISTTWCCRPPSL